MVIMIGVEKGGVVKMWLVMYIVVLVVVEDVDVVFLDIDK